MAEVPALSVETADSLNLWRVPDLQEPLPAYKAGMTHPPSGNLNLWHVPDLQQLA